MFQIDLHWPISEGVTDFKIAAPSLWEKKKRKKKANKTKKQANNNNEKNQ